MENGIMSIVTIMVKTEEKPNGTLKSSLVLHEIALLSEVPTGARTDASVTSGMSVKTKSIQSPST